MGDKLIVGVNDDDGVRRLKGRCINPLEHRMEVLRSLRCVDLVLPFSEETPDALIRSLRPDLVVKGGDWRGKLDGVVIVDYVEGCSTTGIINRIKKWDCELPRA